MKQHSTPNIILIAGPNGSGKSTTAPQLLRDTMGVVEFVNADAIAVGLSAFRPEQAAIQAGRIMLARMQQLAENQKDFAFETTLASRSFAPWIKQLKQERGYRCHLFFLWLPNPEIAIARVAERVRSGGHDVPESVIRRRYRAGLNNFFQLYKPLADTWRFYDNSSRSPELIALGKGNREVIHHEEKWVQITGDEGA